MSEEKQKPKPKSTLYDRLVNQLTDFGKVKIGELVEGQKKPKKLDYFKVIDLNNNVYAPVHEVYGPKPTELIVQLPYEDIKANFRLFMAQYWPSDIFERCIGVGGEARRTWSKQGVKDSPHCASICQKYSEDGTPKALKEYIECPEMGCYFAKDRIGPDGKMIPAKCKMRCNVPLTILDKDTLEPIPNVIGGVFRLRTTGFHTIRGLLNSAAMIQSQTPHHELAGIPMRMTLEFIKASTKNYEIPRILLTTLGTKEALHKTIDEKGTFRIVMSYTSFDTKVEIEEIEGAEANDLDEIKHEFTPSVPVNAAAPVATVGSDPLGAALIAADIALPKSEPAEAAKAAALAAPMDTITAPIEEPVTKPKAAKKPKTEPEPEAEEPAWMKEEPPVDDSGAF